VRAHRDDLTHHEVVVLAGKYPREGEPQSCVQLAEALGISRQAVQQAEARALVKVGLGPD
jgi:DNA-directed RNA polymerase sigma subunit (sigma70/sigma32)